jgi:integrase
LQKSRTKHNRAQPIPAKVPQCVCSGVRVHDLRRTVGSWLAQLGNSLHLIGRVLNHSSTSTTAVYARFGEDSVRAALEAHGVQLIDAAGVAPAADAAERPKPSAKDT